MLILLAGCVGAVAAVVSSETGTSAPILVAVANEDPESNLGEMVLELVQEQDTIASLVEIRVYDTEQEAVRAVEAGAEAALIIPEGFFSSVMRGENLPCGLVLGADYESGRNTVHTYALVGADLLTTAQYAVYGGQKLLREQGADDNTVSEFTFYLNAANLSQAATGKDDYFVMREIPYTAGGLGMAAHYLVLYLAFFLSMLGICFAGFYLRDCKKDMLIRLRASGVGYGKFLGWKLLLPVLFEMIAVTAVLAVGGLFLDYDLSAGTMAPALFGLIACGCMSGLLAVGLGRVAGPVQFVILLLGLFFMGGIIPYSRLSTITASIGGFTPLGAIYGLFAPLLGEKPSGIPAIMTAVYLSLAALLARIRLGSLVMGKEGL